MCHICTHLEYTERVCKHNLFIKMVAIAAVNIVNFLSLSIVYVSATPSHLYDQVIILLKETTENK